MKRILSIMWLLGFLSFNLFAQKEKNEQNAALEIAKYLVEERRVFYGKSAGFLYKELKRRKFPIKHMSTMSSGLWGAERARGVVFYNYSSTEIDTFNPNVVILEIRLDMNVDDHEFWQSISNTDDWMERILEKTKGYGVDEIEYRVKRIYPNEWKKVEFKKSSEE